MQDNCYPIGKFSQLENPTEKDIQNWIQEIAKTPQLLKETLQWLSEDDLELTYKTGGWTIKQLVHHIADNDMHAYFRIKKILTEPEPTMSSYQQEQWAKLEDYKEPIDFSINMITAIHQRITALLNSLNKDHFKRTMISETFGVMNLEVVIQRLLWHDRHHIAQIDGISSQKYADLKRNSQS